jgi:hypothetical protein
MLRRMDLAWDKIILLAVDNCYQLNENYIIALVCFDVKRFLI